MGEDGFGLNVNLTSDPGGDVELPDEVEGVPVQVEGVGNIRKRLSPGGIVTESC
ncbi:MAG TPA: hypothetical protein VML55_13670 [Planctomycetaceae bacterium]|nr:hypothetical protein [Planctomycetaceae bacterium]